MFPALCPRLVNNKKLQQFTINSGRDEIRGGRWEEAKTKYPHLCFRIVILNVVIFIEKHVIIVIFMKHGCGRQSSFLSSSSLMSSHRHLQRAWWRCLRGGWWQDKQREGRNNRIQVITSSGERQGGSCWCNAFSPFIGAAGVSSFQAKTVLC